MEFPAPDRWHEIDDILRQAQDHPASEREAVLDEACGGDEALRREVETLLDADAAYGEVVDGGAAVLAQSVLGDEEGDASARVRSLDAGQQVGPYRLLECIGEGGTSLVYRAERADEQFERTVAVKVLRSPVGADSDAADRFRMERQILASLSHPHLAEVYDGGVLEDGRPYLVMEYVEGRPITEHCREEECTVDERLALFRQAAAAVQAAHEQLVVHRDLKPSNVFVEQETGTIKLLDFGIAKILGELPGGPVPATQTGRQPMTPAYAAPEQVKGEAISVATDTYALGVLLYELLTGHRPHGGDEQSPYAVARAVCEESPPPPSRVTDDPDRRSLLEGDLDAIIMTALRKNPDERYDTVEALAEDLDRYRTDRPVRASQGNWVYRARKFVRRNRNALFGTLCAVILLAALGVYHVQRLSIQRDEAREEAEKAEQVSQFLVDLFEASDPEEAQGDPVRAETLLDRGAERVSRLEDEPEVQASLLHTLGRVHRRLGHPDEAADLIRQSVERYRQLDAADPTEYADAVSELGLYRRDRGEYEAAADLLRDAVELRRSRDTPEALAQELVRLSYVERQLQNYEAARTTIEEALAIQRREFGEEHMGTAESYFNLAAILRELGRYDEAETYQRRSLSIVRSQIDPPHPGLATNYTNLGLLLKERGRLEEAGRYYRKALEMNRALYDAPHSGIALLLQNLGSLYTEMGRYDEAEPYLRDALEMRRALHEDEHTVIAGLLHNLGVLFRQRGNPTRADSLLSEALAMKRSLYDSPNPDVARTLESLALLREDQGRPDAAEARFQEVLSVYEESRPDDHPTVAEARSVYGGFLLEQERPTAAEAPLQVAYHTLANHSDTASTVRAGRRLATCLIELERYDEADSILTEARTLAEETDATGLQEERRALDSLAETELTANR